MRRPIRTAVFLLLAVALTGCTANDPPAAGTVTATPAELGTPMPGAWVLAEDEMAAARAARFTVYLVPDGTGWVVDPAAALPSSVVDAVTTELHDVWGKPDADSVTTSVLSRLADADKWGVLFIPGADGTVTVRTDPGSGIEAGLVDVTFPNMDEARTAVLAAIAGQAEPVRYELIEVDAT